VFLAITFFFLISMVVRLRQLPFKLLAGTAAFLPAMLTGFAVVNHYYAYYVSWGGIWQDLTNSAPPNVIAVPDLTQPGELAKVLDEAVRKRQAAKNGFLMETPLNGAKSRISRNSLIYLPPQYFQKAYADRKFPALELLHGTPGNPYDYDRIMNVVGAYKSAMKYKGAKPAVLVMPDSNGGQNKALQCLNVVNGPQDETYLVEDVPAIMATRLRVLPPGRNWGLEGFSEGGFCAANLALRNPAAYAFAGVLSGYFVPVKNVKLPAVTDPFAGDKALALANNPLRRIAAWPHDRALPLFWFSVGGEDQQDMVNTEAFLDRVRSFQPRVRYDVIKGGNHSFAVWRLGMPHFLKWALKQLPKATTTPEPAHEARSFGGGRP
jgi:S-formylglutathione hydrolase FrmB